MDGIHSIGSIGMTSYYKLYDTNYFSIRTMKYYLLLNIGNKLIMHLK